LTLQTSDSRAQYNTNGTIGPWYVPFYFLADGDLQVTYTDASGVDTVLGLTTQYTVSGAGDQNGGSVRTVSTLPAGGKITIVRIPSMLQETDYVETDRFPAATHERALDLAAMRDQYLAEQLGHTLRLPEVSWLDPLPMAAERANTQLLFDSDGQPYVAAPVSGTAADVLLKLINGTDITLGDALMATKQPYTGAVTRTQHDKNADWVNVKDFGAVGTANIANEALDTAAFIAALATGRNVLVPEGRYYLSSTVSIGYGQKLQGQGQYKTNLIYSGTGTAVYLGSASLGSLIYNCELSDLTVFCTNRASTINGVELQNCVYFKVSNVSIFGSGNPNSSTPADRVLVGHGLYLHDNTIVGHISQVSCRLWSIGKLYACDAGSQSRWTAAIVDDGHGEVANNMRGIVVGDPAIPLYSGAGVTFRDLTVQGNYTSGVNINSGDNTVVENCYFEGNANYDVTIGSPSGSPLPIGCKVLKCLMGSESIGTTPYGTFPYIAKVYVDQGVFTAIRDNEMSISTSIPLVVLAALADQTSITGNRLNSTAATNARISDGGTSTITADNFPEAPQVVIGSFTRTLTTASGSQAITGLGFKPRSIEFTGSVDGGAERFVGFASADSGVQQRCMHSDSAGATLNSTHCIRLIRSSAGNEQQAVLASMDKDGFTLTWTKVGAPPANDLVINYIARR
jgi:hypothetical protein